MTKIIQISDPHIVPNDQLAYGRVNTLEALRSCVETINQILPKVGPVDMAVVTGDLTDFGTTEEYQNFRDIMAPLLIPYRAIPGNHDSVREMRANFLDQNWMPQFGPINWTAEFVDMALIGLDSNVVGQAYGNVTEETLDYLERTLNSLNNKPVVVAIHHPPILTGIESMDIQNLRESRKLRILLSNYEGELKLVCGHIHRNIMTTFGGVICHIAPGTSHAITLDMREDVPNSFTEEPGAFLLHELRGSILTNTIYIGNFDGPHKF